MQLLTHGKTSSPPLHRSGERGMSLIEVLIAVAIMALAGVAFLAGLTTAFQGVMVSQKSVTKESLAKSQIEYIKSQPYDENMAHDPPQYLVLDEVYIPSGYGIMISAVRLDPKNDGTVNDDGLQQITVTISRNEEAVLTVSDYRVKQ